MKLNNDIAPTPNSSPRAYLRRSLLFSPALLAFKLSLIAIPLAAQAPNKPQKTEEKITPPLAKEIQHQLSVLPYYSVFDHIVFTLDRSSVTLSGQVVRPTLKAHAEAAVKSLEGVDTVINRIEVLPVSPSDDDLRRSVYRAVFEDPVLSRYAIQAIPSIHIIVKTGNVTLEGAVQSESDKNLAALRAASVSNLPSVTNNLVVSPKPGAAQ